MSDGLWMNVQLWMDRLLMDGWMMDERMTDG
jgi:hypothetical protein